MFWKNIKKIFARELNDNVKSNVAEGKFKRNNDLIVGKFVEFIPAALITNLSSLLIVSVDGLTAGNFISDEALACVNIFYPVNIIIAILATLLAQGIGTTLSLHIGHHDYENLPNIKSAMKLLMVVAIITVAIIQIPIVHIVIASYNLSKEMQEMTYSYATGMMIVNPIVMISTVGVSQLQIIGKMKAIMFLSFTESILNLIFDILFVGVFKMGIAGNGYGTAIAGIVRAAATFTYIYKKTDMYQSNKASIRLKDIKEILSLGMPDAAHFVALAFKNYTIMQIILIAFGGFGGVIKGVCTFCYSITSIFILGVVASMRPLVGFFEGAKDDFSLKNVMRLGSKLMIVSVGFSMIIIEVFPKLFYNIHSVDNITSDAILSLRLYACCFIFIGFDSLLRLYLTNKKDTKFTSIVMLFSYFLLPVFAFALYKLFSPPALWLSNLFVELIIVVLYAFRCRYIDRKILANELGVDYKELAKNKDYIQQYNDLINKRVLYLSVKQEDAIEASQFIRKYALENGFSKKIAYRISLCMEEMVNYAVKAHKKKNINIQIIIRFDNHDEGVFIMLDDGKCIALDKDDNVKNLTIDNYDLLKKISKSYDYQYVLDMNHTVFHF